MDKLKLNWKLVLIHLLATSLLVVAIKQLGMLNDPDFYENLEKFGLKDGFKISSREEGFSNRISQIMLWGRIAPMAGLIVAFAISITLALKSKISWLNSLIVLLIAVVLNRLGVLNHEIIKTVLLAPGNLIGGLSFEKKLVINGLILILASLCIFLSVRIRRFIVS